MADDGRGARLQILPLCRSPHLPQAGPCDASAQAEVLPASGWMRCGSRMNAPGSAALALGVVVEICVEPHELPVVGLDQPRRDRDLARAPPTAPAMRQVHARHSAPSSQLRGGTRGDRATACMRCCHSRR